MIHARYRAPQWRWNRVTDSELRGYACRYGKTQTRLRLQVYTIFLSFTGGKVTTPISPKSLFLPTSKPLLSVSQIPNTWWLFSLNTRLLSTQAVFFFKPRFTARYPNSLYTCARNFAFHKHIITFHSLSLSFFFNLLKVWHVHLREHRAGVVGRLAVVATLHEHSCLKVERVCSGVRRAHQTASLCGILGRRTWY